MISIHIYTKSIFLQCMRVIAYTSLSEAYQMISFLASYHILNIFIFNFLLKFLNQGLLFLLVGLHAF